MDDQLIFWPLLILAIALIFAVGNTHAQKTKEKIKLELVEMENEFAGGSFTADDVKFLCIAYCSGSLFPHIVGVTSWIGIVGGSLFIRPVRQKLLIPIRLDTIFDIKVFSPAIPYIMNLNAAAVLANEATRREIGNSVAINFIEPDGKVTSLEFGQFKAKRAEDFARFLEGQKIQSSSTKFADAV